MTRYLVQLKGESFKEVLAAYEYDGTEPKGDVSLGMAREVQFVPEVIPWRILRVNFSGKKPRIVSVHKLKVSK